MREITERIDAMKATLAHNVPLTPAALVELGMIGLDFVGELIANSARIATALETIAANTAEKVEVKAETPGFRSLSSGK